MAKAKNYGIMNPEEVIEAIARSKPGKLEIDMVGDFIPVLADTANERNRVLFRSLVDAYLGYIARTQDAKSQSPKLVAQAADFVWGLCQDLDKQGIKATSMFREYKPRRPYN